MERPTDCLDDDLADRFVHNLMTHPDEPARVRAHIAECSPCRRLVSELVKRVTQPLTPVRG